jgi:zinc finger protein, putative
MNQNLAAMSSVQVQSYCLRRKNHYSDMAEHFERMFKEETMVDVTLSCGDGCVKAHKMVLSACSTYFKNIFSKFTNPYQYPVVIIKDMPFEDLRAIIEFIYRGEVVVPQSQLASILRSAEALKVKGLSDAKKRMDDEEENSNRKRKRRKKKAKTDLEGDKKSETSANCGSVGGGPNAANSENNGHTDEMANPEDERDSTEEGTDYSDDDSNQSVTNITPINHQVNTGRTFTEANSNTEAEIEPSRLLEQSMITGEVRC